MADDNRLSQIVVLPSSRHCGAHFGWQAPDYSLVGALPQNQQAKHPFLPVLAPFVIVFPQACLHESRLPTAYRHQWTRQVASTVPHCTLPTALRLLAAV